MAGGRRSRALLVLLLCCTGCALALDNGLARKPAMGFNTWNAFRLGINEQQIKEIADLMVDLGLQDAGYQYLNLDDGWSEPERDADGRLVGNKEKFPSGIKALADYVHSKGLKFGIYGDAGDLTCARFPGSLGFEEVDAQTWADWGVDYLKYDNCWAKQQEWIIDRYTAMRDALNKTGRPVVYSLCSWGVLEPWLWGAEVGHSWRTTEDIVPFWDSIAKILDYSTGLSRFAGPGAFNDLDLLYLGNEELGNYGHYSKRHSEERTQFALWALFKSPLMISHDLRTIDESSVAILKSKEVIGINQDDLGVPGDLIWQQGQKRIFAGPLAGGARAVVLTSFLTTQNQYPLTNITVYWEQIGLRPGQRCRVRDLYEEKDLGVFDYMFSAPVLCHDVLVLRITPLEGPMDDSWRPWHQQPIYAPQPVNLAVPEAGWWIAGRSASSGSGSLPAAEGGSDGAAEHEEAAEEDYADYGDTSAQSAAEGPAEDGPADGEEVDAQSSGQHAPLPAGGSSASSKPPSFAIILGGVVAVLALLVVGYYIVLHRRMRGWQALEESKQAAELSTRPQQRIS